MITYIKRTQKDYTLAFKLAVVAEVEAGAMTYKQAQRHYGVLNWKAGTPKKVIEEAKKQGKIRASINKCCRSLKMAKKMVQQAIEIYNNDRPHLSLNYKTPNEVHRVL